MSATLLDLTSDEYHADPCAEPSLNSTTARILLSKTPAHAKAQHPRLSDVPIEPRSSDAMNLGTAVHQILLRDDRIDIVPFDEWRTNEAKAMVAEIRAAGRIPMKQKMWDHAQRVADAIREQMRGLVEPTPFTAGQPEVTLTWQEDDTWLRARLDWLRDDLSCINDLKVTSLDGHPKKWERQLFNNGYDVQAALYVRGVQAVHNCEAPRYRWVIAETTPPYACSVVELSEQAMFAASVKVETALSLWNQCMRSGEWPAYDTAVYVAEIPGWQRAREDAWGEVDVDESVPF